MCRQLHSITGVERDFPSFPEMDMITMSEVKRMTKKLWSVVNANDDMATGDMETAIRMLLKEFREEFS